jgi:hypothetical protein
VPDEEQRRRIAAVCAGPAWILDSAYGAWLDVVLDRADLVVGLDYPRWFSLQRLLRRCAVRLVDRKPICNGNYETFRVLFARDSIVAWHFRSFARKRARIRSWELDPARPPVRRLRSAREADGWLRGVRALRRSPSSSVAAEAPSEISEPDPGSAKADAHWADEGNAGIAEAHLRDG